MVPTMQLLFARALSVENGMQGWAIRVIIGMTILSVVTVTVRIISRRMRRQKLWWDDWLCIISMVSQITYSTSRLS